MRQMFLAIDEVTWKFSDPQALIIGKLHDRYPDIQRLRDSAERNVWVRSTLPTAADCLEAIMADLRHNGWATPRDATLVGACPWFDDTMLAHAWRHSVNDRPWHYHLVDIETLAAGWVGAGPPPWRYGDLLAKLGVDDPETGKHTAAGDVQVVVQAYAKVYDLTIEDLA